MIPAVRIFIGHGFRQVLGKLGGAIVEVINILIEAIAINTAIAARCTAGFTDGLRPMVAGIIGVLAGGAVKNCAFPFAANQRAIRIQHIAGEGRLPVTGIKPIVLASTLSRSSGTRELSRR